jgi:hypothetical protein
VKIAQALPNRVLQATFGVMLLGTATLLYPR